MTEIEACPVELKPPLEASKVIVEDPSAALEATLNVTVWPEVLIVKGEAGFDITPAGKPVIDIEIDWSNPFTGWTEMATVPL